MRVIPYVGRKGDVICDVDGLIGLFDRRGPQPVPGVTIDAMVCSAVMPRVLDGDYDKPVRTLVLRPIDDDAILIDHGGFECSGSMCCTTARITESSDRRIKARTGRTLGWITPGRTPVIETDNVNVSWNEPKRPLWPCQAYVSVKDVLDHQQRICGVPHIAMLDYWVVRRLGFWPGPEPGHVRYSSAGRV